VCITRSYVCDTPFELCRVSYLTWHLLLFLFMSMMRICLWTAVIHPPGDIWVWMRKPKNLDKNLFQCHFSHHMSHMDWPRQETGKEKVYSMWDEKYQYLTNGWLFLFVDGAKTFLFVTTFSPALSEGGFTKLHSLLPSYSREIEYIENNIIPRCQKYGQNMQHSWQDWIQSVENLKGIDHFQDQSVDVTSWS
jgi:hypothetical protein